MSQPLPAFTVTFPLSQLQTVNKQKSERQNYPVDRTGYRDRGRTFSLGNLFVLPTLFRQKPANQIAEAPNFTKLK